MPNKENLINKGFDKKPENINREGRPKKIFTILKEKGYTKDDFHGAVGELFWYTSVELKEAHSDEKKPIIIRIIANQLYLALQNGDFAKIRELSEHYIGKAVQKIEQLDMTPKINVIVSSQKISNEIEKLIDGDN
jgi:hypothetical protein